MNCCITDTISFVSQSMSTIPFEGAAPDVEVLYRNEAGEYQYSGMFSSVVIQEGNVVVDHGGEATGVLLIRSL